MVENANHMNESANKDQKCNAIISSVRTTESKTGTCFLEIKGGFIMKHLLKMLDLSKDEIIGLLNLADQLKYEKKYGIPQKHLEGPTLGMIFQKSATRPRVSV